MNIQKLQHLFMPYKILTVSKIVHIVVQCYIYQQLTYLSAGFMIILGMLVHTQLCIMCNNLCIIKSVLSTNLAVISTACLHVVSNSLYQQYSHQLLLQLIFSQLYHNHSSIPYIEVYIHPVKLHVAICFCNVQLHRPCKITLQLDM